MPAWVLPVIIFSFLALTTVLALTQIDPVESAPTEGNGGPEPSRHSYDYVYQAEAEAVFQRFAERHGFHYQVEDNPMDLCWKFPAQPKLSMPIILGLQNSDELNFGVSDFWSYFFPFEQVVERFELAINAWVAGDARIAVTGRRGRLLQIREGSGWRSIYGANGCLFLFRWAPLRYEMNDPSALIGET